MWTLTENMDRDKDIHTNDPLFGEVARALSFIHRTVAYAEQQCEIDIEGNELHGDLASATRAQSQCISVRALVDCLMRMCMPREACKMLHGKLL